MPNQHERDVYMASGRMEFHAESIMQHTNFSFVIANDVNMEEVRDLRHYDREPYNLILLHGLTGTDTDWMYSGVAQEMAVQFNLNVFMPTTGNSFYLNKGYRGANWCQFIGDELPRYIRETFRLNVKRENTIIGGFSMGGYGALHNALEYPESFFACIALSSALVIHEYADGKKRGSDVLPREMLLDIFGDPNTIEDSVKNPEVQYSKLKRSGADIPKLYLACGTEDTLIGHNRAFAAFLKEQNAVFIFEEGSGAHNWAFCNKYLEQGLSRLI